MANSSIESMRNLHNIFLSISGYSEGMSPSSSSDETPPAAGESRAGGDHVALRQSHVYSRMHAKRWQEDGTHYKDLRPEEKDKLLRHYLSKTHNAHEYLLCYRLLNRSDLTHKDIGETLGRSYYTFENGTYLPNGESLKLLQKNIFGNDTGAFNHFESLVIKNRCEIIRYLSRLNNPRATEEVRRNLPDAYWQESIARLIDPRTWQARKDKPEWSVEGVLADIRTRGDYCRALRYLLPGAAMHDIHAQMGVGEVTLKGFEAGIKTTRPAHAEKIARYLEQHSPLFNRLIWESLPPKKETGRGSVR